MDPAEVVVAHILSECITNRGFDMLPVEDLEGYNMFRGFFIKALRGEILEDTDVLVAFVSQYDAYKYLLVEACSFVADPEFDVPGLSTFDWARRLTGIAISLLKSSMASLAAR